MRPRAGEHLTEAYYASRTLQVPELLTFNDLSCPQVAASLQVHPRTARRLLLRLAADGYIEQTFDSRRRYRATLRLAALGRQVIAHARLPRVAAPYVAGLHDTTGALAHLFIPSYCGVACVVHCDGSRPEHCPEPMLRELLPAHATAAGKVLLAFREPWRDSVLANALPRYTHATVTSRPDIERSATQVRARGYAIDDGEYRCGMLGIAAPIFVGGHVPAALALSGARRDVDLVDALRERVVRSAAALTLVLDNARPPPMTAPREQPPLIRAALLRKALADPGQRAALARRLGLTDKDVLAVQHLASAGELTPGQLSALLQLSSAGTTGLIHRLQQAGHITRESHGRDRRSAVLRLTAKIQTCAADAWAPLVAEIDSLVHELSENEAQVIQRFLERVADAAERHANRLAADADSTAHDALAVPLPALWA